MNRRIALHLFFWVLYFLFEGYLEFAWISSSYLHMTVVNRYLMALAGDTVLCIPKITLSYFIIFVINNHGTIQKNFAVKILLSVTGFAVAIIIHRLLIVHFTLPYIYHDALTSRDPFILNGLIASFMDLVFIVGVVVAIKQYRLHQGWQEKEKNLVKEKLESELKFLRTQTNPHFLFNTLNNIYALARKKSDHTADVVMKLSKLLRFMLYESRKNSIAIADEIRMIEDYIELEKIRYNERLNITFTKNIDSDVQPISPMILLPFIENAFKHGASETRFSSFIHISIQLQHGQLQFSLENSKEDTGAGPLKENIGLSNVRRQLELMYASYDLRVDNLPEKFCVHLNINLNTHAAL